MKKTILLILFVNTILLYTCQQESTPVETQEVVENNPSNSKVGLDKYTAVKLTTDISQLSEKEKQMIPILVDAAKVMDELFWYEAYGEKTEALADAENSDLAKFTSINYGPWDRLANNESFIEGVGEKAKGANFYPKNMTKEEFEAADLADKNSLYTFLRRDEKGQLKTIPYHEQFKEQVEKVADLLKQAAQLAEDKSLKKYLELRATALLTDEYQKSDFLLGWI